MGEELHIPGTIAAGEEHFVDGALRDEDILSTLEQESEGSNAFFEDMSDISSAKEFGFAGGDGGDDSPVDAEPWLCIVCGVNQVGGPGLICASCVWAMFPDDDEYDAVAGVMSGGTETETF
jgi:hypothetical protein